MDDPPRSAPQPSLKKSRTQITSRTPRHDSALATRSRLHSEAGIPKPPLELPATETPEAPEPPEPGIDPDLIARAEGMRRRLDALEHKEAPGRQGPSLGL